MVAMRAMCNFYLNINHLPQCLLQRKALFADRPNPVVYAAAFGGDGSEEIKRLLLECEQILSKRGIPSSISIQKLLLKQVLRISKVTLIHVKNMNLYFGAQKRLITFLASLAELETF